AAVPATVIIGPVPVFFAVRLVVLVVVRDKIVEREAVVTRDEIHALFGLALFVAVHFGASDHAIGHAPDRSRFTAEEVANIIAEAAVPLLPGVADKAADLV